ncbi:MAG TPA: hypothetical protein VJS64_03925 [Pyrinomonadaceae bacterium]|nr:hypothetical protein [Pyrinomonadaceae bacterium]
MNNSLVFSTIVGRGRQLGAKAKQFGGNELLAGEQLWHNDAYRGALKL